MGKVYDFEKARSVKYATPPCVAPESIEVPEFVLETIANRRAKQCRELMRVATGLIHSSDIPVARESAEEEVLPVFEYLPTEKE